MSGEETDESSRPNQLPLSERKVKISRKWAIRITAILSALVVINGTMITIIFMMRKGMW